VRGQTVTAIEADTNYLWNMKGALAAAVAADDKEKISEYKEALLMLISLTESRAVKVAAWRALATAQATPLVGTSDTVRPFVRRVVPVSALAIVAAACSFAAAPSMTDPPLDLPFEVAAVVIEQPSCAAWIDSCE
jgi:hypothetical protein